MRSAAQSFCKNTNAWQRIAQSFASVRDVSKVSTSSTSFVEYTSDCVRGVRWTRTCTKKIPVELLQNVDGVGLSGEVAHVSAGYARNYLVPGRMARQLLADASTTSASSSTAMTKNTVGVQALQMNTNDDAAVAEKKKRKKLEGIVRKLTESVIVFKKDDAGGGVLTESIRRVDIVEAVGKQLGIEIVEGLLDMEDEDVLTTVGDFVIPLKLVVHKRGEEEQQQQQQHLGGDEMHSHSRGGGHGGEERAKLQIRVLQKNVSAAAAAS